MYASYHNHTSRCHHARGTDEEYLLAAIRAGYGVFGFSDHAPHAFPKGYVPRGRMEAEQLRAYVLSIRALADKYKNDISVRIGLESEYFPELFDNDIRLFRESGVEYLILGQHTLGSEIRPDHTDCFKETDNRLLLTKYTDTVIEAARTGKFSLIAHPDVMHARVDEDFYRAEADRLIAAAKRANIPLEVNLTGISEGRHYPNPLFWQRAGALSADVIIGVDAHSPAEVFDKLVMDQAYRFIERHKLNLLDVIQFKRI